MVISWAAAASAAFISISVAPTAGDSWRKIHTDADTFALADANGDGRISDHEFAVFHSARTDIRPRGPGAVGVPSTYGDDTFTPNEIYPEAEFDSIYSAPPSPPDETDADDGHPYDQY